MKILARLDWLGERSKPHFGQLTLVALLICSYALLYKAGDRSLGERAAAPATVLSWLPELVLRSEPLLQSCMWLFIVCGVLWLLQIGIPWSSWGTALGYTAFLALRQENIDYCGHTRHITNMLLILYAMWYHFYRREIALALQQGAFWTTPLFPRWVHAGSIYYIGIFYGYSGLYKIIISGWSWPNGVSLQLWTNLWGDPNSFWTHLILSDRTFAWIFQIMTLAVETGGILAVVSWRLRPLIGLGILGFHYGAIAVFSWGFHANAVLVGLMFLPIFWGTNRLVERLARRRPPTVVRIPDTLWGRLKKGVLTRCDFLARWRFEMM